MRLYFSNKKAGYIFLTNPSIAAGIVKKIMDGHGRLPGKYLLFVYLIGKLYYLAGICAGWSPSGIQAAQISIAVVIMPRTKMPGIIFGGTI